jgi:hypothetical protein
MSAVYTKRLLEVPGASGLFTAAVPAGKVWIVENIALAWAGSTTPNPYSVARVGGATFVLGSFPGDNLAHYVQWGGRAVLNGGETLQVFASQAAHWHVAGYELTAL